MKIDHVQLAIPPEAEVRCAPFWTAAGFAEIAKPEALRGRGGAWYRCGDAELHLGVTQDFTPARKAHPAFLANDLDHLAKRLQTAGALIRWDDAIKGKRRFFTEDPVGNRIEFMESME